MKIGLFHTFMAVILVTLIGCNSNSQNTKESNIQDSTSQLPSHTSEVKYAKTFSLEYKSGYKLLHYYNPFSKDKEALTYVLLPQKAEIPEGFSKKDVIRIPIKRMITTTTVQTTMIEALGCIDAIKGYVSKNYMYSEEIINRMDSGKIISVGYDLNTEKIIASSADLVMVVASSSTNASSFPILQKVNIPVLANSDWQESHLLGRAEWIKLFGALFNKEKEANAIFNDVEKKFNNYIELAQKAKTKPTVISGLPYKGMWSVPGGRSYLAIAFDQINVNYPWKETSQTGSIQLDLEGVFAKGGDADYWINIGTLSTINDLKSDDPRYTKFKAFKTGNLYNNNKRVRNSTANDYWGTGILHPELILGDLIKIFHPELLPDYELFFYQKLK